MSTILPVPADQTATLPADYYRAAPSITPDYNLLRLQRNISASFWFFGVLWGLALIFALYHLIDRSLETFRKCARLVRCVLIHRAPVFRTVGHAVLFIVYTLINVAWTFGSLPPNDPLYFNNIAKRLGWLATCNISLLTFLALKNTPLAFLTAHSYEKLNILHRLSGWMALVTMLAHTFCYVGSMLTPAGIAKLLQLANVMGAVGGIAMVGMAATALFLRRLHYEVFYVIHVGLYVLIIVAAGMHRPDISTDTLVIVIVTGMLWFSDRLLRAGRLLWYLRGNTVTLTPLPCGGTRVVLKRPVARAVPGKHIFLYIPSIRIAQSHPFTISAVDPITLVISGHDGFTKDLARVANANPGIEVKASMEGPYGSLVDWERYDHLVFIAGGSGASFAFGVVTDLLEKWERGTHRKISITFVWVVREQEMLSWYTQPLLRLQSSAHITTHIHLTHPLPTSPTTSLPHLPLLRIPSISSTIHSIHGPSDSTTALSSHPPSRYNSFKEYKESSPGSRYRGLVPSSRSSSRELLRQEKEAEIGAAEDKEMDVGTERLSYLSRSFSAPTIVARPSTSDLKSRASSADLEKGAKLRHSISGASKSTVEKSSLETVAYGHAEPPPGNLQIGRPDIQRIILLNLEEADREKGKAVLVAACGPDGLMRDAREAVGSWVGKGGGIGVTFWAEEFGW